MSSKVNVDDEEDEKIGSETKSESDEVDCYKESKPKKKKKVDVMSFVSVTADRLNLSVGKPIRGSLQNNGLFWSLSVPQNSIAFPLTR